MFTYVGNNPINRIDPMGLAAKVLVLIGKERLLDYDIADNGDLLGPDKSAITGIFKTFKKENVNLKYELLYLDSFSEFDLAINKRKYNEIILIAHGNTGGIRLNKYHENQEGRISRSNLNKDKQSFEQWLKIKDTNLTIYSCNTGKGENPIAKSIQEHYGFDKVYAPNGYVSRFQTIYYYQDIPKTYRYFNLNGYNEETINEQKLVRGKMNLFK